VNGLLIFLLLLVVNVQQLKILPKPASSKASQRNCAIAGQRDVHVQCIVDVKGNDLVHLVLNCMNQSEREVLFLVFAVFLVFIMAAANSSR